MHLTQYISHFAYDKFYHTHFILHIASYTLPLTHSLLHIASYTLHLTHYILHNASSLLDCWPFCKLLTSLSWNFETCYVSTYVQTYARTGGLFELLSQLKFWQTIRKGCRGKNDTPYVCSLHPHFDYLASNLFLQLLLIKECMLILIFKAASVMEPKYWRNRSIIA